MTTTRMGCTMRKGMGKDIYKNWENVYNREGTAGMMVNLAKDWEKWDSLAETGYRAWRLRLLATLGKTKAIYKKVKYWQQRQGGKAIRNYKTLGKR